MKSIKELLEIREYNTNKGFDNYYFNYDDILNSFEFKILLQVDDEGYRGDTRVLFENDDGKLGYLLLGWGSCPGCDVLQGCNSWEEVEELQIELYNSIKWLTPKEMLDFMRNHDWQGDYNYNCKEQKQFIEQSILISINKFVEVESVKMAD